MWLKYFNEALEFKGTKKLKEEQFFTVVFNYYLINYYSPAPNAATSFKLGGASEQVQFEF